MKVLKNPQNDTKVIVVGGTNAKGSTCFNLNYNLSDAGFKVGCFTSPHLHSVRERIRIGNDLIPIDKFSEILTEIKNICKRERIEITYFEALTAVAYYYFSKTKIGFSR